LSERVPNDPGVQPLNDYLAKLASDSPAPGGGSAAMVVGATGCSLVAMVARICAASKRYAPVHDLANLLVVQADDLRERLLALREQDEAAFDAVVAARGDKSAMQHALQGAAAAPLEGARKNLLAMRLSKQALALGNANLVSDVGCAAEFSFASLVACAYNVRINHKFMKDEHLVAEQAAELQTLEDGAAPLLHEIRSAVAAALRA
jgi:methenyltetrahydrofolate cyclohydrolase